MTGRLLHLFEFIADVTPGDTAEAKVLTLLTIQCVGTVMAKACIISSILLHLSMIG